MPFVVLWRRGVELGCDFRKMIGRKEKRIHYSFRFIASIVAAGDMVLVTFVCVYFNTSRKSSFALRTGVSLLLMFRETYTSISLLG